MRRIAFGIVMAGSLAWSAAAFGAPVTVAWDANPVEQKVTGYCVQVGGTQKWCGPETQTTLELAPGAHTITATAKNQWGESAPSVPVSTPGIATSPQKVVLTITVQVQ